MNVEIPPIPMQTAIAFTPDLGVATSSPPVNSGLFPGSSIEKIINDIKEPTNCGRHTKTFKIPRLSFRQYSNYSTYFIFLPIIKNLLDTSKLV